MAANDGTAFLKLGFSLQDLQQHIYDERKREFPNTDAGKKKKYDYHECLTDVDNDLRELMQEMTRAGQENNQVQALAVARVQPLFVALANRVNLALL